MTSYCLLPARGPVGGPAPGRIPFQSVTPAPPLPSVVPQRVLRLPKSCPRHRNCGDPAPCHSWACLGGGGAGSLRGCWPGRRPAGSLANGPLSALCRGWRLPPPFSSRKRPHPVLREACSTRAGRLPLSWGQLQGHAAPCPCPCPRPAWRRRTQPLCREQLRHRPLPQQCPHLGGFSPSSWRRLPQRRRAALSVQEQAVTLSQARGATAKTQRGTKTLRWGGGSQNPAGR